MTENWVMMPIVFGPIYTSNLCQICLLILHCKNWFKLISETSFVYECVGKKLTHFETATFRQSSNLEWHESISKAGFTHSLTREVNWINYTFKANDMVWNNHRNNICCLHIRHIKTNFARVNQS